MQITHLNNTQDFPKFILHLSSAEMRIIVNSLYKVSYNQFSTDETSIPAHRLYQEFMQDAKSKLQDGLGEEIS